MNNRGSIVHTKHRSQTLILPFLKSCNICGFSIEPFICIIIYVTNVEDINLASVNVVVMEDVYKLIPLLAVISWLTSVENVFYSNYRR